jgi:hypothetical protein
MTDNPSAAADFCNKIGHKRTSAVKPPSPCGVNASRLYISSAFQQRNIARALRSIFQVANGATRRAFSVFLLSRKGPQKG